MKKVIFYVRTNFLAVLKDVPNSPFDLLKNSEMDAIRMGLFPSLDYKGLYNSIIPLIEVAHMIPYGLKGMYYKSTTIPIVRCLRLHHPPK